MPILGKLIARSLRLRKKLVIKKSVDYIEQEKTLRKLLERAQYTSFGKHYEFTQMLEEVGSLTKIYQKTIPYFDYNKMHDEWWYRCLNSEENVSWPGKVKYFALSSGTSESASKHIPVTNDMIKAIKKVGVKQFYSMTNFNIPPDTFGKGILMLGGTTSLFEKNDYFEGDMSGISAKNMPKIFANIFYKPGHKISKSPNWEDRIKQIVENAPKWDVGTVCGVPAWVQIVLETIIEKYNVKNIHEIWPNFNVYIHGGVAFEPYRETFKKLLGHDINFIETYMASEGSFGFRARPNVPGIKLSLDTGVFYEFVPFNEQNFDEDGHILPTATTKLIHEVTEDEEYAVLLSTCSGAWRYLIGDTVKFTDVIENEIVITGRTKQFLSLCGEHMSVDNINKAIDTVKQKMDLNIGEFTVGGYQHPDTQRFAHMWYIGCDDKNVESKAVLDLIDKTLCEINDDYAVERTSALPHINIKVLPSELFIDYLKETGRYGAMNKFPRVLKHKQLADWEAFLSTKK